LPLPHSGHFCPACGARQLLDLEAVLGFESFILAFGRFPVLVREFGMIFQLIRCTKKEKVTEMCMLDCIYKINTGMVKCVYQLKGEINADHS